MTGENEMKKLSAALAACVLALLAVAGTAAAAEPQLGAHVLPNRLAEKQNALRQNALQQQLNGAISAGASVAKVGESAKGKGQSSELQQTGSSKIFVILAEFGDLAPFGGAAGPLHNAMTPPNRAVDNTTIWYDAAGGYTPALYQSLYFDHNPAANSVANYYLGQSNGRFTFDGGVTNWTKVKYNEARYGTNLCGSTVCTTVWSLLRDAANQWVLDQLAAGQSMEQIQATLASYDVEDRYDYDEDGNFNEPDHYIDHFQLLHAGADEAVGGGAEGTNAIWSHRWFAWQGTGTTNGKGPTGNQARRFPDRCGRRSPDRHVGRRLPDDPGELGCRRDRARDGTRLRLAGRVRPQLRRRRVVGLLDDHVRRLLRQRRHERHRQPSRRLQRVGQVAARLARPAGRRPAEGWQDRAQARTGRGQHEAGAGRLREAAGHHEDDQGRRARRARRTRGTRAWATTTRRC